jgi:hypothetical protein
MKMQPHVEALVADLEAVAAAGDDAAAEAATRLAAALRASAGLRLLDALSEATLELNAQLTSGRVEVRLAGRDPELVYVEEEAAPAAQEAGGSARITLRLPEGLKAEIEAAAGREGASVNAWLVRALARSVGAAGPTRATRGRLTGYGRS